MKIVVIEYESFGLKDAIKAFEDLGHKVICFKHKEMSSIESNEVDIEFNKIIDKNKDIDLVFSLNYYPNISKNCNEKGIKYISIVYDNPQIYTYHYSVANKCNRIFLFDYSMYKELYDGGLRTVFYMPLPVNVDRYDDLIRKNDKRKCEEVSFVGSMYNEKHNLFDRMSKELVKTSPGTLGYLEGIMQAQSLVDGYWMIEDLLSDDIVNEMKKAYNYVTPTYYVTNDKYVYANYFLARKTTQITRTRILNKIANRFKLSLYTTNNTKEIVPNAIFKGNVEYYDEMPLVFHYSKININLTLKSIKTGIPLRVLDIMAAGGFVITNYQEDLFRHFTPDEDFVFYQDENDLINKIQYYLEHEEERKQIAQNGYRKVREICSYKNVIKNIIE